MRILRITVAVLILYIVVIGASACRSQTPISTEPTSTPEPVETVPSSPTASATDTVTPPAQPSLTPTRAKPTATPERASVRGESRGYLTTPEELAEIRQKADQGMEPYASAVEQVLEAANTEWSFDLDRQASCGGADRPRWIDDERGVSALYARALAYHLTGEEQYAEEVKGILEEIMSSVETIDIDENQCRLNFSWGTPEVVAAADLIEAYWYDKECTGPVSTEHENSDKERGNCKALFQNWLVKNPYYITSFSAASSKSNWGAAATNTTAYIADYLWDRPEVKLIHRHPEGMDDGEDIAMSPAEAYTYANQLMFDRMNGYGVEYGSSYSCDYMDGEQQSDRWDPVKSQITEAGIIPEDARREEFCNIPEYDGTYQNYPQIHLGNNIQQCELMLRRGDSACYDNVDETEIPEYTFAGPDGEEKVTHLYPGRGSIERAIKAIIVDSETEWRHDSALEVAYRYYYDNHTLPGFDQWFKELDSRPANCAQDVCFGTLTHGFADGETPAPPPVVAPPGQEAASVPTNPTSQPAAQAPSPTATAPTATPTAQSIPTEPARRSATGPITAIVETDPVPNSGDAADDIAIWVHPDEPAQSLIIGTDKKGGIAVYDLTGAEIEYLRDGDINNVDVRDHFPLGDGTVSLAAFSNRSDDTIELYRVDPTTRTLENVTAGPIEPGDEPYGLCMYHSSKTGKFYVFVTDQRGDVEQWELFATEDDEVDAEFVRIFDVGTQSEGCVADDELGYLYVAEEEDGIWKYGAEPDAGTEGTLIATTDSDGHLDEDVEGLTMYYADDGAGYLIASSQGSDEFIVYRRDEDNAYVTSFKIEAGDGIDEVTGTDGIDVTSKALGTVFPDGLFVAQDNSNDDGNQNFKLVPWDVIETHIQTREP